MKRKLRRFIGHILVIPVGIIFVIFSVISWIAEEVIDEIDRRLLR